MSLLPSQFYEQKAKETDSVILATLYRQRAAEYRALEERGCE